MQEEMTPDKQERLLKITLEFLSRAELKGAEVQAYSEVWNWVQAVLAREIIVIPAEVVGRFQEQSAMISNYEGALEELSGKNATFKNAVHKARKKHGCFVPGDEEDILQGESKESSPEEGPPPLPVMVPNLA